jgi:aspartate aminotransferase
MLRQAAFVLRPTRFVQTQLPRALSSSSHWVDVPLGPPDAILGLTEAFNKDDFPKKVSVGVGAYRDDQGKPFVLPAVSEAEKRNLETAHNHEYAGITGVPSFVKQAESFCFGPDSLPLKEGRLASTQALSGTGALRIAGEFFSRFAKSKNIFLPDPTWGNHIPIFKDSGLNVQTYRYYDRENSCLDFEGLVADIKAAESGSIFLLHACAHNPTGMDPTSEQWMALSDVIKEKGHVVLFDSAYQGFASGDMDKDAFAIRHFVSEGHNLAVCMSFSKNFGLYGQRVGLLSFVCGDEAEQDAVLSQLKILIRPMYSNPPVNGARLVDTVLSDADLRAQFESECKGMASRIHDMRTALKGKLEDLGSTRDWSHITSQIGMFCYSGLDKGQVETMKNTHHIYMTGDGRISMAGVTSGNVDYIAEAIHDVTK